MTLTPILTRERAAGMSAKELIIACAAQVDAQNPTITEDEREAHTVELYESLASEDHRLSLIEEVARERFNEIHAAAINKTASSLFDPDVNAEGELVGVVSYRGSDGLSEMLVHLPAARPEDFERPFHLHHREQYQAVAKLMRKHGMDNYQAAYEAGIFTSGEDAS